MMSLNLEITQIIVNNQTYTIETSKILNYPNKSSMLYILLKDNKSIVIEKQITYFDKILQIYGNPKITLRELFGFDDSLLVFQKDFHNFCCELEYFGLNSGRWIFNYIETTINTNKIIEKIENKINSFDINYDEFIKILKYTDCYIYGEFIISCILDNNHEYSIDICMKHCNLSNIDVLIENTFGTINGFYLKDIQVINTQLYGLYIASCVVYCKIDFINIKILVTEYSPKLIIQKMNPKYLQVMFDGYALLIFDHEAVLSKINKAKLHFLSNQEYDIVGRFFGKNHIIVVRDKIHHVDSYNYYVVVAL